MLVKKSVYKILCKGAKSGKEAYTMLQEYVMENILNKTDNMLDIDEDDIYDVVFDNVFSIFENSKAKNEKEADLMLNEIIDEELSLLNNKKIGMKNIEKLRFITDEDKAEFMKLIEDGDLMAINKFDEGITYIFAYSDYYKEFIFDNHGSILFYTLFKSNKNLTF